MLDAKQVAERLGVSVDHANKILRSGEIEVVDVSSDPSSPRRRLRVTPESLDRFISKRSIGRKAAITKTPRATSARDVKSYF